MDLISILTKNKATSKEKLGGGFIGRIKISYPELLDILGKPHFEGSGDNKVDATKVLCAAIIQQMIDLRDLPTADGPRPQRSANRNRPATSERMNTFATRTLLARAAAADLVEAGMVVGLGTGSTAVWFVRALAARGLQAFVARVDDGPFKVTAA